MKKLSYFLKTLVICFAVVILANFSAWLLKGAIAQPSDPEAWDILFKNGIMIRKDAASPGVMVGEGPDQLGGYIKADQSVFAKGFSTFDYIVEPNTIEAEKICLGNGINCITSWPDSLFSNTNSNAVPSETENPVNVIANTTGAVNVTTTDNSVTSLITGIYTDGGLISDGSIGDVHLRVAGGQGISVGPDTVNLAYPSKVCPSGFAIQSFNLSSEDKAVCVAINPVAEKEEITLGPASGDVSGTYPNLTVSKIQGKNISLIAPSLNQVLKWNGSAWAPANDEIGASLLTDNGNYISLSKSNSKISLGFNSEPSDRLAVNGVAYISDGAKIGNSSDDVTVIRGQVCLNGTGKENCLASWPVEKEVTGVKAGRPATCGNNILESPEYCDGKAMPESCQSLGFLGGTLTCNDNCTFNTSRCSAAEKKYVFVTSTLVFGRITYIKNDMEYVGIDAANIICNDLAESSIVLPREAKPSAGASYRAWLSTPTYSPNTIFYKYDDIPYFLAGSPRIKVVDDWNDLVDGSLDSPINRDENGKILKGQSVWTGSDHRGTLMGSCGESWNNNSQVAFPRDPYLDYGIGNTDTMTSEWTFVYAPRSAPTGSSCNYSKHLYCFQQ